MKIYGLKMHNFMRFGNVDNSIVFNVTKKQKEEIKDGKLTFDLLYGSLSSDPVKYIETVDAIDDDNVFCCIWNFFFKRRLVFISGTVL